MTTAGTGDKITLLAYGVIIERRVPMDEAGSTQSRILQAAMAEFLEKDFSQASLRNIVKAAGVTTGAFYRYYPTK